MWGGKATCVGEEKYVYVGREGHVCGRVEVSVWERRRVCGRVEEGDTVSDHAQYKNSLVGLS